jgi:hypothetical protein
VPGAKKLTVMVASTVHHFEDHLPQICGVLTGFGYEVWNSHLGTIPRITAKLSNLGNCIAAVGRCDAFLGIVRPYYGSGKVGERSITHEEFLEAIRLRKPRWFLVGKEVTLARQLLKPYMFEADGKRTDFKLKKNPVIDDLRVIDLYNDAIQNEVEPEARVGHWVQEYYRLPDALTYIDCQFRDPKAVKAICKEMSKP